MGEAYRSMYIVEDNMDLMRKAAKGAMQTIKFKDGKLKVDSFTASAIMGVHAKVNPKNRASMENMINSGTKAQILKLQSLAMKSIKSENDPTVDEHANGKPHPHPHEDEEDGELATVDEAMRVYRVSSDKKGGNVHAKNEKEALAKAKKAGMKGNISITDRGLVKDLPKARNVREGSWHIAKNMNALKKKMQKPIPKNDLMVKFVMKHIGDDELADEMFDAKTGTDMVPMIKSAMKRLNIREETLDEKFTRKDFDKNEDQNRHTENAVELVNMFGDNYEKRQVAQIKKDHDKKGHIEQKDQKVRDALVKKYLPKLKEEVDLDESRGMTAHVIVMRKKDNKNLSVSVVANTKNVNAKKKEGYVIDKALLAPNGATARFAKEIDRIIRDGDKNPKTGGYVKEEVSEDYVITVKGKEVSKHKEEKDARSEFSNLRKKHGNDVKITKEELDLDEARQLKDKKKEMMVKSKTSGVIVIDKSDFEKYKKKGFFAVEGFSVNEAKGVVQPTKDGKGVFKVLPRDTKGMSGKQDPFSMGVYDKSGKKLIKDLGSHPSLEGAKKFARNHGIIEGLLDEAKYDIYHKTFSAAMQHAYAAAKKMYGITVDPSEIDKNVATGPKKPSSGKTNKYRLKGDKGSIQVQVANLDNKKYELNMYKEGFPHGDGGDIPAMEVGTDRYRDYAKTLTPGETPVEEGSAGADARRQMSRDKDLGRNKDSADDDNAASDDDIKAASKNIIMQMRKVISLRGNFKVEFGDGKKEKLDPKIAQAVISKYNSAKRPAEKEKFQKQIAKSKKDLLGSLKESLQEGKMKELHGYIQQGKSAKEISKLMKVDVNTIKKLMSSYSVSERTLFRINSKIKERKNG